MMKIKIKESNIIRPNQERSSNNHLWLSNIDILLGRFHHTPVLYLYKQKTSCSNFFDVKLLKDALKEVLVQFSPVAGRLKRDEKGRIEIICNGEGVLFVEAQTDDFALSDINDFTPTQQLWPLTPTVDYSKGISSYPLLLLQLTKFKCGGVSLGVGWHHILADAYGLTHFLRTWSNSAKGLPMDVAPSLDRNFLRSRIPPSPTFHRDGYPSPAIINSIDTTPKPSSLSILKITPDHIKTLKARLPNNSTFEMLAAHAWRCTTKARCLPKDKASMLQLSVNGKSRLSPPASPNYFGNLVVHITVSVLCGELVSESLQHTVDRIHEAIKRVDDEYVRSGIDYLEQLSDFDNVKKVLKNSSNPNMKIVSWMNISFYDLDFGWGKPIYFRGANPWEGKGHIIASPTDDDGTLLFPICLETHHLSSFEKLFYDGISDKPKNNGICRM